MLTAFAANQRDEVRDLHDVAGGRVASVGTVGGTGAIRQALELIRMANPDAVVHVSDPTWPPG